MIRVMEKPVTSRSDPESRRMYTLWHYNNNKEAYKARSKAHTAKTRAEIRAYLLSFLRAHPCVDCGEADPVVLDFDHTGDQPKLFSIAVAVRSGYSLTNVKREMDKCDVRCANCHRRITYIRAGWTHKG